MRYTDFVLIKQRELDHLEAELERTEIRLEELRQEKERLEELMEEDMKAEYTLQRYKEDR